MSADYDTQKSNGRPVSDIESGVYMLDGVRTVILYAKGNPPYLASKPNMGLKFNPVLLDRLRVPTETEREALLGDSLTLVWLTNQVGKSPQVRQVINDFLGI